MKKNKSWQNFTIKKYIFMLKTTKYIGEKTLASLKKNIYKNRTKRKITEISTKDFARTIGCVKKARIAIKYLSFVSAKPYIKKKEKK